MGIWLELKFLIVGEQLYPEHSIILELETVVEHLMFLAFIAGHRMECYILLFIFFVWKDVVLAVFLGMGKFFSNKRERDLEPVFCLQSKYIVSLLKSNLIGKQ